jgi:hypothetical protein
MSMPSFNNEYTRALGFTKAGVALALSFNGLLLGWLKVVGKKLSCPFRMQLKMK